MEEEGIWSLGFIFSGLADWGFFLCVDEEKRKKKRRREGLGERKKKRRWPWRERKKKRRWSATPWVSTGSRGSGLGVLILLVWLWPNGRRGDLEFGFCFFCFG
jgi:hypothetical protein